jgi:hypothetical protein
MTTRQTKPLKIKYTWNAGYVQEYEFPFVLETTTVEGEKPDIVELSRPPINQEERNWCEKCRSMCNEPTPEIRAGRAVVEIKSTGKAKSDKLGLGLVFIPFYSIYRIGKIFIEGLRYGRDNWRKGIYDSVWQEERLEHALNHLLLWKEGDRSEDHLAKVAWFCVIQMELLRLEEEGVKNEEEEKDGK